MKALSQIKSELLSASGRDFERKVHPWLKLLYPELVLPASLKDLDKKGVDMAHVTPGSAFPVVVQCKGFEVSSEELSDSQVDQVVDSVQTFLKSNVKCDRYILLYNRGGANQEFAKKVKAKLSALTGAGIAKRAELWSLDDLTKDIRKELTKKVCERLRAWSEELERTRRNLFPFDDVFIEDVPVQRMQWSLKPGGAKSELKKVSAIAGSAFWRLLLNADAGHFSLVTGEYGMGKSTMMRRFTLPSGYWRLLIPAGTLRHAESGGGSEHALLEYLLRHTGCLAEVAEATELDRKQLERVASACLAAAFHSGTEKAVLIIDGLDENRAYSQADGFQLLANELGGLRVPVIFTTRKEHFYNRYLTLQQAPGRAWLSRSVETEVFELSDWSRETSASMLDKVSSITPEYAVALKPLSDLLGSAQLPLVFSHPLWLSMAIDLCLQGEASRFSTQYALYEEWTCRKLMRDAGATGRDIPSAWKDQAVFAQKMTRLMTDVAVKMCQLNDDVELIETIDEEDVQKLVRLNLPTPEDLADVIAQTSLLIPTSIRTPAASLQLRFSHYSFHEFFVAKAIRESKLSIGARAIPEGVEAFLREQARI